MGMAKKQTELFQYILVVKKEHPANIDLVSSLLCFMSCIFFLYYSYVHSRFSSALFWAAWLIPVALAWTIRTKRKFNRSLTYKNPLFVTGVLWLFVPGMRWVALMFIVFILFDHQSRQPLEIGISDEKIVINTFFRKRYEWSAFSNVVLKDGLLTLDFKNNKVLQREVVVRDTDETEFNSFCREQVD